MSVLAANQRRMSSGFTLIEVLVVVTMIGIIAAIAIPNYSSYIQRGHRADAKAAMMLAAQWQERIRRETNNYSAALPAGMGQVPTPPAAARYNLAAVAPIGAGTFVITATAVGSQAGDECGNFTIDQLGVRRVIIGGTTYGPASAEVQRCWGR